MNADTAYTVNLIQKGLTLLTKRIFPCVTFSRFTCIQTDNGIQFQMMMKR